MRSCKLAGYVACAEERRLWGTILCRSMRALVYLSRPMSKPRPILTRKKENTYLHVIIKTFAAIEYQLFYKRTMLSGLLDTSGCTLHVMPEVSGCELYITLPADRAGGSPSSRSVENIS